MDIMDKLFEPKHTQRIIWLHFKYTIERQSNTLSPNTENVPIQLTLNIEIYSITRPRSEKDRYLVNVRSHDVLCLKGF